MSIKENLLNRFALTVEPHELEGEQVFVKQITAAQAEAYQFKRIGSDGKVDYQKIKGARAELVAMCLCEEDGSPLFTEKEVGALPSSFVEAAYALCSEVCALRGDVEAEEAEKN